MKRLTSCREPIGWGSWQQVFQVFPWIAKELSEDEACDLLIITGEDGRGLQRTSNQWSSLLIWVFIRTFFCTLISDFQIVSFAKDSELTLDLT